MDNNYKIIIYGKKVYREYELEHDSDASIKVGTSKGCNIRFNKENFFGDFSFEFLKSNDTWIVNSLDGVYFTEDGVMKVYSKELKHGDDLIVKYEDSSGEVFKVNFFIDFDSSEKNYNREIDILNIGNITIGGLESCDIYIKDELLGKDYITLSYKEGDYYVLDNNSKYGVHVNATKVQDIHKLKENDFIIVVGHSFYFKDRKLYTSANSNVIVKNLLCKDLDNQSSKFKYPKFNRSTRIRQEIPSTDIEILDPEPLPQEPKKNLVLTMIPVLAMLALTVVLRGIIGGGGTFVIYSVCSMSIGIIMSVVTFLNDKKEYKKEKIEREVKYKAYIGEKEEAILNSRSNELRVLNNIYKPMKENIENVNVFSKDLFDRNPDHDDFLAVRIGKGLVEANCKVIIKKQEYISIKDELVLIPKEVEEKHKYIKNAPVYIEFLKCNGIGVIGNKKALYSMLKNMTIDIVTRHYYKDVKLFYIIDEDEADKFAWLRWLKNVENDSLEARNIIYDEESKNLLFEYLYVELCKREERSFGKEKKKFENEFVIFVFDNKGINKHPISKFLLNSTKLGFTFVFFEENQEMLPMGCDEIIVLNADNKSGTRILISNGEDSINFTYEEVSDEVASEIALKLSPVYIDEVSLESELTKNISLFQLLNIVSVDDLNLKKRWEESEVYKSMAAPLGVKTKGEVVYLDLNEKHHGPHGLVAGTTGSGKSEILQSYILSMATFFHPYEVGFVIIDFKGGGMVNQFKDLPHLIGAITNIDGREITRSLLSIKAELRKRQELFAKAEVNHVDAYIKNYKAGEVDIPLPHLIIIVDEFAELKAEHPDFMKELISAARIGRSLGVHLILATQKPSGVVDDQIWSNSKFKLCLKVQNKEDSNEVIKTPLAAEIKEPGRAYLQVGNNEIFELFQSAYSGADAETDEVDNKREFTLNTVSLSGKRTPIFVQKREKSQHKSLSQLEAIVEYVNEYCKESGIEVLQGICMPPLKEVISYKNFEKCNDVDIEVGLGIYDDPSRQLQDIAKLNITAGNTFIIGSSQYGKTNLLQTIVRGLAENYSPQEVNIYILDFASMILKTLNSLNHVGGVVTSSEDEKLKNFIKMINSEITYRKEVLSKAGISSFSSYKEAGFSDLPQILIMVDNFIGFRELYGKYDDEFLNICRECISVGISVIITTSQTNGIGYKYLSNFANRIGLYCNDSSEYSSIFDRCRMQPRNIPGRGLIEIDKTVYEYQTYLGFEGTKEIDRVNNMKSFINAVNERYKDNRAKIIPEIPKVLTSEYVVTNYNTEKLKPYMVPVGLNYSTVDLVPLNLAEIGQFILVGKDNKPKVNLLKLIMDSMKKKVLINQAKVYVIDNVQRNLRDFEDYGFVERYSIDSSEYEIIFEDIADMLEDRYFKVMDEGIECLDNEPLILVIINNKAVIDNMATNKNAMEVYKKVISKYKTMKVCIIFSEVDNAPVAYSSPEIMKLLRDNKKAFIFENMADIKVYDIPANIQRDNKKALEAGDSYLINGNEVIKVKIATE